MKNKLMHIPVLGFLLLGMWVYSIVASIILFYIIIVVGDWK